MGLFQSGFKSVRKEQKRQEEFSKALKGKLFNFFLTEKAPEATVYFLNDEPLTFDAHNVEEYHGGKKRWQTYVCPGEDCPYCNEGQRASFKGMFLVYDTTPFSYKGKDGKEHTNKGQLKVYIAGTRVLSQLDRLNTKYKGLTHYSWDIARTGSGTATTYSFDRGEDVNFSRQELENMMPDAVRQDFTNALAECDGNIQDAIMTVLEIQGKKLLPNYEEDLPDDDDAEEISDEEIPFDSGVEESPKKKTPRVSLGRKLHKKN